MSIRSNAPLACVICNFWGGAKCILQCTKGSFAAAKERVRRWRWRDWRKRVRWIVLRHDGRSRKPFSKFHHTNRLLSNNEMYHDAFMPNVKTRPSNILGNQFRPRL